MEATIEQWEENEEVDMGLRGRPPRQNSNANITTTNSGDVVYSSQSSAESLSAEEEEEEGKGSPRNGFHMVSNKNGGTESPYGISGFNGGHVDSTSKNVFGNEIVASEVESLSFQKSVETNPQDEDIMKLKDEELPGFGSSSSKQSIEQSGHYTSLEDGKAEHGRVKLRDINEQEVSELYLEKVYEKAAAHEFFGNEIVASEVESLSFQKSVETNPQDEDIMKLKDEELPGFGSSSSKQSIEQSGHYTSLEDGKAEHGRVKLRDINEQEVSELYLEKVYEKAAAHEFFGNEIVASEVESLSFQKSVETNPQDEDIMKLKDEELPGFGSSSSKQSIEQSGHYTSLEDGKAEHERVKLRDINEQEVSELYLEKVYEKATAHEFFGNEIVASEVESLSFQKSVETNPQDEDIMKLKDEELPGFGSSSSKQSIEQSGHYTSLENGKAEHGRVKLRDINEQEVSELYLEKVYEKAAAHEFYCPNCNACITKVLIRDREAENRPETVPLPEPVDPVRCTSCFSFLIPAGNWFFPKPVPKDEENRIEQGLNIEDNVGASVPSNDYSNGTMRDENSQIASVGEGTLPVESVGATKPYGINLDSRVGVQLPVPSQDSNGTLYDKRPPTSAQSVGVSQAESVDKSPEPYLERKLGVALVGEGTLPVESVGATKPYGINLDSRVGVQLPVPSQDSNGTLYDKRPPTSAQSVGVSQADSVDKSPEPYLERKLGVVLPVESVDDSNETLSDQNSPMAAQSVVVSGAASIAKAPVPGQLVEASINGVQVPVPSHDSNGTLHNQKPPLPGQSVVSITVTTQSPAREIDDAGAAETRPSESTTVIIRSEGPPIISEPRDAKTFEILKSTVYGGLTEAIASLSIVTSAASAGTATSNILALALANLVGGLFIIGHNLWELKVDQSRVTSNETDEQVDRYQEVLGKRENFFLHAPVAILSFLIFGLVPPLVYGFSFRQSNDRDLKLAAVAASSLVCIILLAIGKAYNQNPPKYIKTVLYYVIIGVGVAGVSYVAGDLIDKLIVKLGWFNSTVAGTLPLPQMSIVKPAWKSW